MGKVVEIDRVVNEIARFKGYLDDDMIYRLQFAIKRLPTVDAEPVKHGRWEQAEVVHDRKDAKIQDWQQAKCSVCGRWQTTPFMYYLKLDNYCPNCGAKMDCEGRKENERECGTKMGKEREK